MATNPIQKKTRNSFMLGMLVMFILMGIVVAVLAYMIVTLKEAENDRLARQKNAYIVSETISSGNSVDSSMLKATKIDTSAVPTDAVNLGDITENTIAKIDISKGTIITSAMITEKENAVTDSLRIQEYNMLKIASQIQTGDFIDVRLRLADGQDYIVVSKKKVEIPQIDGSDSLNTIWIKLTEEETIAMSNAIVEAYQMSGSVLYTTKYVEPGMQGEAIPTYVPSAEVQSLMRNNDSNIVDTAKMALLTRYNTNASVRDNINNAKNSIDSDDVASNVSSGVKQEISTAQEQRQDYLDALSGNN